MTIATGDSGKNSRFQRHQARIHDDTHVPESIRESVKRTPVGRDDAKVVALSVLPKHFFTSPQHVRSCPVQVHTNRTGSISSACPTPSLLTPAHIGPSNSHQHNHSKEQKKRTRGRGSRGRSTRRLRRQGVEGWRKDR